MVKRYGQSLFISKEMAQEYGLIARSREEQAARDAETAQWRAERAAKQPAFHASIRALDRITEQPTRSVLDLHQRVPNGQIWRCEGCEATGYEWDYPEWPCRTTLAVAEHYGITMPGTYELDRPEDGSLDARKEDA